MFRSTSPIGAVLIVVLAGLSLVPATTIAQSATAAQVTVSGVVVDASTGEALAAYVQVWTSGGDSRAYNETKTGTTGGFSMQVAAGRGSISAQAADGNHQYYSREIDLSSSQTALRLELTAFPPKTAVLEGVVTDKATGKPIQGAWVSLGGYAYATPASGGGTSGSSGSTTPVSRDSSMPSDATAPSPPDSCCYGGGESVLTDAAGRYRLSSYAGGYEVYVRADGHAWASERVDLAAGTTTRRDFALEPMPARDATLVGTVTDTDTGKPVAGAQVSVSNLQWGQYDSAYTDANGRFTVTTMPGYTQIWVSAWKSYGPAAMEDKAMASGAEPAIYPYPGPSQGAGKNYYPWTDAMSLVSGTNDLAIPLKPKPEPTQALQGYVVDAKTSQAIAGAWVNLRNEDTGEWGSARTGDDGSYKIMVRPGWLVVDAGAEGHFSRSTAFAFGDAQAVRLDLVLEPGTPRYGGGGYGYAESAAAYDMKSSDGASPPLGAPTRSAAPATEQSALSPTTSSQATGTYSGGAGGLGPYDGKAVTEPATAAGGNQQTVVPGAGALLAAVAAIAVAFVALRRRA